MVWDFSADLGERTTRFITPCRAHSIIWPLSHKVVAPKPESEPQSPEQLSVATDFWTLPTAVIQSVK